MDELELDLDIQNDENLNNRANERITSLSSKVKETAKERDDAKAAAQAADEARQAAEKKMEFLESFTNVAAKYPNASEYREAIQEKVMSGYTVEDAAAAVLVAEGKYTPPAEVSAPIESPAGGSAATALPQGDGRSPYEMTQEERRQALLDADKRGEVAQAIERGLR